MTEQAEHEVREIRTIRQLFGDEVVLFDEQDESTIFHVLTELSVQDHEYAVLQSDDLRKEDEVAIFRIDMQPDGQPMLATIEDDDEWEMISELYDSIAYPIDEK